MGNVVVRFLITKGIKDTQCGFKAFSERAALSIFPHMVINRWGFDFEALAVATHMGFRIKEVPVTWVNDTDSRVRMGSYIRTLMDAVRVYVRIKTGKYSRYHAQQTH